MNRTWGVVAVLLLVGCGGQPETVTETMTETALVTIEPTAETDEDDLTDAGEVAMMLDSFGDLSPADQESVCARWTGDLDDAYGRLVESGTDVRRASFEAFVTLAC